MGFHTKTMILFLHSNHNYISIIHWFYVFWQWSHSLDKPETQSLFCLEWSSDGTQVAGGCGNGHVIFAHVVERLVSSNYIVYGMIIFIGLMPKMLHYEKIIIIILNCRRLEWKHFEATVRGRKTITVQNVCTDLMENLDFRDNIIKVSFEHNHLIVVTSTQCYIYRYVSKHF